jgi:peptidoglycan/xylan/chitin deacetylase (PgdA/CDA1 family)
MAGGGYPRDLRGYGRNPPHPHWPGNARIAVQFVVNFEEGGENNILHGDRASEAFLSDVLGAQPWPGQRHANIESMFEYGSRAGFWRLWRIFTGRNLPVTVFGVATALKRNPEVVAAMKEATWDIASHSLKWVEHKDMSEAEERLEIADAIRLHTEVTGERPLGWYTGRTSINTVRLVMVYRADVNQHREARDGSRRFPLFLRLLRRRPAVLDQGAGRAAPDHSL